MGEILPRSLPIMAFAGRLCPVGVAFSGFRFIRRKGFQDLKYVEEREQGRIKDFYVGEGASPELPFNPVSCLACVQTPHFSWGEGAGSVHRLSHVLLQHQQTTGFFCRILAVLENRRLSQGRGGGDAHPCTLPLDPPLGKFLISVSTKKVLN